MTIENFDSSITKPTNSTSAETLSQQAFPNRHESLRVSQSASSNSADGHLPPMSLSDFKTRAENLLSRVVPAGTDAFSSNDLVPLLGDPAIKGQDALALATLYELSVPSNVGLIQKPQRSPLTSKAEVAALPTSIDTAQSDHASSAAYDHAGDALTIEPYLSRRLGNSANPSLYADRQNPLNSIKMEDVHQGASGDCYFEASLAATAKQNPALIRDAIHTNSDGTYTVTFPGDKKHPVTVTRPTEAELALYNGGSPDGIWAPIIEKAFARYATDVLKRPHAGLTNEDTAAGGDPYDTLQLLNGHDPDQIATGALASGQPGSSDNPAVASVYSTPPRVPEAKLASELSATLHAGRSAVLSTTDDANAVAGLTNGHSYAISDYTPGANGGQVTLRNPDVAGDEPAIRTVNLDTLYRMAAAFDMETNEPEKTMPFVTPDATASAAPTQSR